MNPLHPLEIRESLEGLLRDAIALCNRLKPLCPRHQSQLALDGICYELTEAIGDLEVLPELASLSEQAHDSELSQPLGVEAYA